MYPVSRDNIEIVDLSHPLRLGLPAAEPHGAPDFGSTAHALSGTTFTIGRLAMSAHTGTHVDAPSHLFPGGKTLSDFPLGHFFGSAVVADFAGTSVVTADALRRLPVPLRRGEALFISWGRAPLYGTEEYRTEHPYLADDAAEWVAEMEVTFLGVDAPTPDMPSGLRGSSFHFPVHRTLLGADCLIIENLNTAVAGLTGRRVSFCALPLPLEGLDGSPVRIAAWDDAD